MADVVGSPVRPVPVGLPLIGRLRSHLSDSFSRNAYALMVNTGMNGILGLAFWVVAARNYSPTDVGVGSALISAFTLLSAVIGINVTGTLTRFLPRTGHRTTRFVTDTYWISSAGVVVLSLGFLALVPLWGPSFAGLEDPGAAMLFLGVVVLSGIFTVQDGVLVGLRSSVWVPIENTVFGVVKLVLLVALAGVTPGDGVYLSFVIAMALVTVPLNVLIFGRLLRRGRTSTVGGEPPSRSEIQRFLAGDYLGALFSFAAAYLIPVIVAAVVLPETFAPFYIVWMVWGSLQLVSINLAQSLTVEGVYDAEMLVSYTRSALRRSGIILAAGGGLLVLGAPILLGFLGPSYTEATALLRLLALTAFPRAVLEVWLGVLRAQGQSRSLARVQVASGIAIVGSVTVGLLVDGGRLGLGVTPITGVGILVLVSQTAVTVAVLPGLHRFLTSARRGPEGRRLVALTVAQPASALDAIAATRPETDPAAVPPPATTAETTAPPYLLLPRPIRAPSPRRRLVVLSPTTGAATERTDPAPRTDVATTEAPSAEPPEPPTSRVLRTLARHVPARYALTALTVGALLLFWLPLIGVDVEPMTSGLGLIAVLPVASLLGLWLLGAAFVGALALRRPCRPLLAVQLLAITVCLHGVTAVLEALPRFSITFVHLGMVDHIVRTGIAPPDFDARFSWPGFFALVGFISRGSDLRGALDLLATVPLLSNLLYVLALALVLRSVRASWQAKWLVLFLFVAGNWVGQDYFSPQGLTYFLYLVFLGVLLSWFRPSGAAGEPGARQTGRLGRLAAGPIRLLRRVLFLPRPAVAGELPPAAVTPGLRTALMGFLLVLFLVTAATHQLTPFVMVGTAAALVLVHRCVARGLPLILLLILLGWISYMTAPYWTGHLGQLIAGVGDLGGTLSSGVQERTAGDPDHQVVVLTRIALCLGLFTLAGLGLWRRARRGVDDRIAVVLVVVPVLAAGLQSYGGEIVLRVYFFALPALCILVALAVFPDPRSRARTAARLVAAGLLVTVLLPGFLLARYGNEAYEQMRPGEYAAVEAVYDQPGSATVLFPTDPRAAASTPFIPISHRDIERIRVTPVTVDAQPGDPRPVIERMREQATTPYLLVTRGQEEFLTISSGFPADWGPRFRAALDASPDLVLAQANPDARLYVLRDRPPNATPAAPLPEGFIGATPWTPVGVVFLAILLGTLIGREVWLLRVPPERRQELWPLRLLWVPLAIAFFGVLVERAIALTSG